jgi:hypothetical protein
MQFDLRILISEFCDIIFVGTPTTLSSFMFFVFGIAVVCQYTKSVTVKYVEDILNGKSCEKIGNLLPDMIWELI